MKLFNPPNKRAPLRIHYHHKGPRILYFDVESIGVNAFHGDTGLLLMCAYKWSDEKETHILTMTPQEFKTLDDRRMVDEISELLCSAPIRVAHYGQYFDIKFINTRRLMHGLSPLPKHVVEIDDTIKTLWKTNKFHSNRLGNVARVLGLSQKKGESNFPLPWMEIIRSRSKKAWRAYQLMAKYCKQDVRTLEEVYLRLHPNYKEK